MSTTAPAFKPIACTPGNIPDPAAVREAFFRDGIVVLHDLYPSDAIAAADAELQKLLEAAPTIAWAGTEAYCGRFETWTKMFGNLQQPALVALFQAQAMLDYTEAIAGPGWKPNPIGSWITPKGCGQAWHQDSWSADPANFCLNRLVFTRDTAPGQGDLIIVPGSHTGADLPAGELFEPLPGQVRITPRRNTTVLLHTRTFHCVTKNETEIGRVQVNCRCTPAEVDPNICAKARFRTGTWNFATMQPW